MTKSSFDRILSEAVVERKSCLACDSVRGSSHVATSSRLVLLFPSCSLPLSFSSPSLGFTENPLESMDCINQNMYMSSKHQSILPNSGKPIIHLMTHPSSMTKVNPSTPHRPRASQSGPSHRSSFTSSTSVFCKVSAVCRARRSSFRRLRGFLAKTPRGDCGGMQSWPWKMMKRGRSPLQIMFQTGIHLESRHKSGILIIASVVVSLAIAVAGTESQPPA